MKTHSPSSREDSHNRPCLPAVSKRCHRDAIRYHFRVILVVLSVLLAFPSVQVSATGLPFRITRVKPLFTLEHGFLQPSDVAVGKDHLIYVMDGVNNRVVVFDQEGEFRFSFGGKGGEKGRFNAPLGIATDSRGDVYVADTGNRRVQIFSDRGEFKSLFAVKRGQAETPPDPVDLTVDEKRNRLYVVDNDNHSVLVYSLSDFSLLERWGSEGDGMQHFRHPFLVALAKDTSVLVVDVLNTRVQVWSPRGEAVSTIGDFGVDLGQLYRPKGVCVDGNNTVFVSDSYVGSIQTFNRYGYFRSVLGNEAGAVMLWETPVGITIDDRERLYVVEMFPNRVIVYKILGKGS